MPEPCAELSSAPMHTSAHSKIGALAGALALLTACGSGSAPALEDSTAMAPEKAAVASVDTPKAEDLLTNVPAIGDKAPPLVLKGTGETSFDLESARAKGPVLAIFYRGYW